MSYILTLTGPSGSGKSYLERIMARRGFGKVVSVTTREPRPNELSGKDYYFVDHAEFTRMIAQDELLESVSFDGNHYGAARSEFDRHFNENRPVVVVVEPNGCKQIREYGRRHGIKVLSVFVDNPLPTLIMRHMERARRALESDLNKYATRIVNLIENERQWAEDTFYEVYLEFFDERNTDEVVQFLYNHWVQSVTQQPGEPRLTMIPA